jgi:hypothetical protein
VKSLKYPVARHFVCHCVKHGLFQISRLSFQALTPAVSNLPGKNSTHEGQTGQIRKGPVAGALSVEQV